ncbi:MAG TPA: DUF2997 domain-containing protein [Anaerolinea sp.]|nr:DUF2997 domain-containing protein [Anaerolinea sp.]
MDLQEIEVQINQDGKVEIRVQGVKDQTCLDITAGLEEALGGVILLREMTQPIAGPNPVEIDQSQQNRLIH